MTADAPGRVGRRTGATGTFGTAAIRRRLAGNRDFGPFDAEDLDPSLPGPPGLLDFGSIRVPVPADGTVTVEPTANGRLQAVHVALPGGRLSVSALAAPKSSGLWAELVAEIDGSLRDGGARVRSFQGDWGRELHARTGAATSVFVGVDGARWMLYGVATGPDRHAVGLEAALRLMLKGTVVDRGRSPFPVRTVLPLSVPEELAGSDVVDDSAAGVPGPPVPAAPAGRPPVVPVRATAPVVPRRIDAPTEIRPVAPPPVRPVFPGPAPVARPPRVPAAPVRPAATFPPAVARPPAADPTRALPVSRPQSRPVPPRAEPPVPLWATPAADLGTSELGRDPADGVGPDPFAAPDTPATEWWPSLAPAAPEPVHDDVDRWAPSGTRVDDSWAASTPLHDELVNPPTERWAAIEPVEQPRGYADVPDRDPARSPLDPWAVGFVDGGGRRPDPPVDDRWSADRVSRHAAPAAGTRPDAAVPDAARPTAVPADAVPADAVPADAVPRSGRRRRAEEPEEESVESTLDLAALVRDRPGRRRSRYGPDEPTPRPPSGGPRRAVDGRAYDARTQEDRTPQDRAYEDRAYEDRTYEDRDTGDRRTTPGPDRERHAGPPGDDRWGAENHGLPSRPRNPDVDLWAPAGTTADPYTRGHDDDGWRAGRDEAAGRDTGRRDADERGADGWRSDRRDTEGRGVDRRDAGERGAGRSDADRWRTDREVEGRGADRLRADERGVDTGQADGWGADRREAIEEDADRRGGGRRSDDAWHGDRWASDRRDGDRWGRGPAPSDRPGGGRRRPDPESEPVVPDRYPSGVEGIDAPRSGRRRAPEADPATDPLPAYPADPSTPDPSTPESSARRRRSVDVPPDPDWVHPALRAGRVRDGSAPALAFLTEPAPGPGPEPDPPVGRHHRPR